MVTPTYQTMSDWLVPLHHQGAYSHFFFSEMKIKNVKWLFSSKWIFILLLVSFYSIWPSSYHSVHHTSCLILVSLFIDDGSQDIKSCIGVIFIFTLCPSENPYKPNVYLIWLSRIWYAWYLLSCIIFPSIFSSLHGINYFPLYLIIKNINYLTFVSSKDQCHRRSVSI